MYTIYLRVSAGKLIQAPCSGPKKTKRNCFLLVLEKINRIKWLNFL